MRSERKRAGKLVFGGILPMNSPRELLDLALEACRDERKERERWREMS